MIIIKNNKPVTEIPVMKPYIPNLLGGSKHTIITYDSTNTYYLNSFLSELLCKEVLEHDTNFFIFDGSNHRININLGENSKNIHTTIFFNPEKMIYVLKELMANDNFLSSPSKVLLYGTEQLFENKKLKKTIEKFANHAKQSWADISLIFLVHIEHIQVISEFTRLCAPTKIHLAIDKMLIDTTVSQLFFKKLPKDIEKNINAGDILYLRVGGTIKKISGYDPSSKKY